jgi:hypothetical protein
MRVAEPPQAKWEWPNGGSFSQPHFGPYGWFDRPQNWPHPFGQNGSGRQPHVAQPPLIFFIKKRIKKKKSCSHVSQFPWYHVFLTWKSVNFERKN